jgi:hypothetical protein
MSQWTFDLGRNVTRTFCHGTFWNLSTKPTCCNSQFSIASLSSTVFRRCSNLVVCSILQPVECVYRGGIHSQEMIEMTWLRSRNPGFFFRFFLYSWTILWSGESLRQGWLNQLVFLFKNSDAILTSWCLLYKILILISF